jgi:hypothetical protein
MDEAYQEEKGIDNTLRLVSWKEWLQMLESKVLNAIDAETEQIVCKCSCGMGSSLIFQQPTLRLLDFLRVIVSSFDEQSDYMPRGVLPAYDTTKMQEISPTIANLPQLSKTDAVKWVKYWKEIGFC